MDGSGIWTGNEAHGGFGRSYSVMEMKRAIGAVFVACVVAAVGCDEPAEETIIAGTEVRANGGIVAWFERPTHATVAATFILKVRGYDQEDWVDVGTFQRITADGFDGLPVLRLEGNQLNVIYESAEIFNYKNTAWVRKKGNLDQIRVRLIETPRPPKPKKDDGRESALEGGHR